MMHKEIEEMKWAGSQLNSWLSEINESANRTQLYAVRNFAKHVAEKAEDIIKQMERAK